MRFSMPSAPSCRGIRKLGESCDLIITGGPLERAWQREDTHIMQVEKPLSLGGGGFLRVEEENEGGIPLLKKLEDKKLRKWTQMMYDV